MGQYSTQIGPLSRPLHRSQTKDTRVSGCGFILFGWKGQASMHNPQRWHFAGLTYLAPVSRSMDSALSLLGQAK